MTVPSGLVPTRITQLPFATSLSGSDTLILVQNGQTKQAQLSSISALGITLINTGAGLTGGPITTTGTISIANTGVVAASYGSATHTPVFSVNVQGQITTATLATITPAWSSITATPTTLMGYGITDAVPSTRTVTAGTGLSGGGALSGNITLDIANTIVAGGPTGDGATVPVITWNARGQLTAVTTAAITAASVGGLADPGGNGLVIRTAANVTTFRTITGSTNIAVADGDGVAANPTISITGQIPLANGGTNANLTASNGGIVYSTATAFAVLAGTATAGQILRSGSNTAPSWSTATYPNTTTINQLLYSSAANTIAGLATANTGALVTSSTGVPSITTGAANRVLRSDGTTVSFAQVALATDVTGILPGANGGTNNGFMEFTGPATSLKTFTLPNATGTIAVLNAVQSFSVAQRGTASALVDGATITPDFSAANNFTLTIGGNRTLANPTNQTAGQSGVIVITQNGTGGNTLAYGANWKFAGGTVPVLTTAANAVDVIVYYVESASRITATMYNDVK
jgi:hypothetical protein